MDKKKSIINIQDLGLSAASQHSVSRQPILWDIFRKLSFLIMFLLFLERKLSIFRMFSFFRMFFQDIGRQPIP
jgi:hypothetical protein